MSRYVDGFGNLCRRVTLPAGESVMRYFGEVELSGNPDPVAIFAGEVPPSDLPDDTLTFTLPEPAVSLRRARRARRGSCSARSRRAGAACPGRSATGSTTRSRSGTARSTSVSTAQDVLQAGKGVCRDFAHLAVTFCRALNIPTRYTFGYLPDIGVPPPEDPMDFCAWMEVFLDGSWWTFDPRNNQRRVGRVLIGRGRDAVDVAMVTTYGPAELVSMEVWADEVVT